jgi:hypothetical protein
MKYSEIICESFTIPVSQEQVLTPTYIHDTILYGFEYGNSHPGASSAPKEPDTYDYMSLYRLKDELQDSGFIPKDIDIDDEEATKSYVETWLYKRFNYIIKTLSRQIKTKDGKIVVYRAIAVNKTVANRLAENGALGEFWSFTGGQVFWGGGNGTNELHMMALVDPNKIDWVTSIHRNMNYAFGEEENEAFLPKGTPVVLLKLDYEEGSAWKSMQISNQSRVT